MYLYIKRYVALTNWSKFKRKEFASTTMEKFHSVWIDAFHNNSIITMTMTRTYLTGNVFSYIDIVTEGNR